MGSAISLEHEICILVPLNSNERYVGELVRIQRHSIIMFFSRASLISYYTALCSMLPNGSFNITWNIPLDVMNARLKLQIICTENVKLVVCLIH